MKRFLSIFIILAFLAGSLSGAYVKNTASKVAFYAWDTTANAPKTGDAANITAYVSIDGGAVTALTDTSATEASATNAAGCYVFDTTAGEMNGEILFFSAKTTTSTVYLRPITIATTPAVVSANVTQLAGSATPVTNLNNVYNTDYATAFNEPNGVFNVRLVDVSDSAQLAALSSGATLQVDASGYAKVSPGTGTGQVSLTGGAVTVGTNSDKTGYSLSSPQTFDLTGSITGNLSGSVGSVTGAVASVTGAVGSVTGTVNAVLTNGAHGGAATVITLQTPIVANATYMAGNALPTSSANVFSDLAALDDFFDTDSGTTYASSVAGSVVKEIADNAASGGGDATAANQTTIINSLAAAKGAGFVEANNSLKALRDRGDAAWLTGSGTGLTPLASGTAQGGTATSITLAAGETTLNFKGAICHITGGTGIRQFRVVRQYNPTTKKADIIGKWDVIPDATSTYELSPSPFDYLSLIMGAMAL